MPFLNLAQYSFLSLVVMVGAGSEKERRSFRKILSKYVNGSTVSGKHSQTDKGSHGDKIGRFWPSRSLGNINISAFLLSGKVEKWGFFPVRGEETRLKRR